LASFGYAFFNWLAEPMVDRRELLDETREADARWASFKCRTIGII
jgi:hypothetical protein